ncbi:primosomal replication protein N [Shewanella sp. 1_MG-2023]|uniref:Replication restart protein PriB n=1 Tax=Shewanella electrodiphila TaxID=934143 RepID=A0ABT0KPD4_9GAMM|nr:MULTISPECIES: primosomal replication protein N [Shewanella]MCL1045707.1 primosomal replication protein N [Shewanella electrodiphila]MCC4834078.1 primosomal replication protein N [Shewanella sp. 10N.7]MDO6613476.1 primosomal replication protein N [Shewanella sp. 7_MG-2023]MDO6773306.1 primosomal replication protein N [Shewanella sp. 2_MG-2023]MDO6795957.1 primosomal replication protein N [Shewanella sp. 1_MG-2023]
MVNHLVLSGTITRSKRFDSPSGIPHKVITLEHKAQRYEGQMLRNVYCLIQVILSGQRFNSVTEELKAGVQVQVEGFISMQQGRNGQNKLVMHAENVELKT